MARRVAATVAVVLASTLSVATAQRVNTSSAVDVFWISDCTACTANQKDSIFCSTATSDSNFVSNASAKVTIAMKKLALGASDGSKFCWSGKLDWDELVPCLCYTSCDLCLQGRLTS